MTISEVKLKQYLNRYFHLNPNERAAVVLKMRTLARAGGHTLDAKFAQSGLGAGPEARIASAIVARVLGTSGSATDENEIRVYLNKWIRESPPVAAK